MSAAVLVKRRRLLLGSGAAWAASLGGTSFLAGCANHFVDVRDLPPVVFVHGNGDSAALWLTTLWRFESNGWPRERLFALNHPYPQARDDDATPQPGRSGTEDHANWLKAEVERVLAITRFNQVVLAGNSRGGLAIRHFIQNKGGAALVSHAMLGGTPNHGVWAREDFGPRSEFNGAGPFLKALNAPKNAAGDEVTGPVRWLTIRSDRNDKFAQPTGEWIGRPGWATHVLPSGPELKGAENVVLPGIDHRETSFSPEAFEVMWRFLLGFAPRTDAIRPEASVVLSGLVTGFGVNNTEGNAPSNLPLFVNGVGATVEVFAVDAGTGERRGPALHRHTVDASGNWAPSGCRTDGLSPLEFVVTPPPGAPGYSTTHIYRSAFTRSSSVVHLRCERMAAADRAATQAAGPGASVVTFTRPRGYFGIGRDQIDFDGSATPAGLAPGVPGLSTTKKVVPGPVRSIRGFFDGEAIVGRTWPAADNRVVLLELHG
jgi:pimeloyl-ACP methyl ester carboxylesterase